MQNSRVFPPAPQQLGHPPRAPHFLTPALMPPVSPTQEQQREGTSVEWEAASEPCFEGWAQGKTEGEHFPERGSSINAFITQILIEHLLCARH